MTSALVLHEEDAGILLIFVILLTFVVLTVWALTKKSLRFLHSTGLALIYGLIVGAIIKYGNPLPDGGEDDGGESQGLHVSCDNITKPEEVLLITLNGSEYSYKLMEEVTDEDKGYRFNEELGKLTFDPEIFFNILLPPIIFNAGYSMKKRHFFRNIGAITLFAFIGTTISTFAVAGVAYVAMELSKLASTAPKDMVFGHCLQFGAMISATDPVTTLAIFKDLKVEPNLDALLFGESVMNDAVAIVLSETFSTVMLSGSEKENGQIFVEAILNFMTVFLGSLGIGTAVALTSAMIFKFCRFDGMDTLETGLFFLLSWSSFLFAEALGLTGIVSILFCGILQAHYTYNNLSEDSQKGTKKLMELLNFLGENFLFIYMGISVFSYTRHKWDPFFIIFSFLGIFLGRFLNVYPLSGVVNLIRRRSQRAPINIKFQHMIMFSGLRGAVAFALALRETKSGGDVSEAQQMMFSTTLLIVFVTVLLLGGATSSMLNYLQIPVGVDDNYESFASENQNKAWRSWYKFDSQILKPTLTNSGPPLTATCPSFCHKLAYCLTSPDAHISDADDQEVILDADELTIQHDQQRDSSTTTLA
ncbi:unnamed protein product [Oikopleura dioica]|uniref:Sodium/hydrogen exchanger n=1 Tax=Oikopleura dioica TaxID=34765 RepID=E4WV99_OIKDI|nr:unnamed protein product [Oikopleura dioica]